MAANAAVSEKPGHTCALSPQCKAAHHASRIKVGEPLIHLQQCLLPLGDLLVQGKQNIVHQASTVRSIVRVL